MAVSTPLWLTNQAMLDLLRAVFLRQLPESLRYVVGVFIVILLKRRHFWLFRVIRVPKGRIICPNACEGLLTFAVVFFIVDTAFRAFFYEEDSLQTNAILLAGIRLFPLWMAGYVHAIAVTFLCVLSPSRLNPILWHLFLFGWPTVLLASTLPTLLITNQATNKSNVMYQDIRRHLMSKDPAALVSPSDLLKIFEMSIVQKRGFQYFRTWAFTAAIFSSILLVLTIASGIALFRKIYSAICLQKSIITRSLTYSENHFTVDSGQQRQNYREDYRSPQPTASYSSTIVDQDPGMCEPTVKSKIAVLTEFLIFTSAQTFCLAAIGGILQGAVTYLTIVMVEDMKDPTDLERLRDSIGRITLIYHVMEMGADIIFGTPLVIMVLYRQCFPMKVEVQQAVQKEDWHKQISDEAGPSPITSSGLTPLNVEDGVPSPYNIKATQFGPCVSEQESRSSRNNQDQATTSALSRQDNNRDTARDACGHTGPGAGSSIVLDALQQVNQYPRRRRRASPWETLGGGTPPLQLDPECRGQQTGEPKQYATPHGIVEGVPLTLIGRPERTQAP